MDRLSEIEQKIVSWLNGGIGWSNAMDDATYLLVSDYFIPLCICFWMLALWFRGRSAAERGVNQRGVLAAAIGLGLANLAVLIINQFVFRERPLAQDELATLLYRPPTPRFPPTQLPSLSLPQWPSGWPIAERRCPSSLWRSSGASCESTTGSSTPPISCPARQSGRR